jgi:UDP-3-O-[3-hydroxymyristoyl] glucosamine N-acyltransferase
VADPRFYENRGPVALAAICARLKLEVPAGACGDAAVADVATIESAGPDHLVFCATRAGAKQLPHARAGYCLADAALEVEPPAGMILLRTSSSIAAFAVVAQMLYPDNALTSWAQTEPISASANIGKQVQFGPGVVVGAKAEIGDGTRIGPSTVIGPGVAIGRNCEIGSNVTITHAYLGDEILVLPGAQIGQPGFGFASGPRGHAKIPQLGRVIVQDRVEIGACTTVDRGALGDTVIGEGTKIDNLVQIGHNAQIGRHCVIVGQVGMSGSCELGDFVVLGGQVGLADHVKIGDGARLAARSAMPPGVLPGGQDYGGAPPVPIREWRRQIAVIARLTKKSKQHANG